MIFSRKFIVLNAYNRKQKKKLEKMSNEGRWEKSNRTSPKRQKKKKGR